MCSRMDKCRASQIDQDIPLFVCIVFLFAFLFWRCWNHSAVCLFMLPHYLPGWTQITGCVSKLDYFQDCLFWVYTPNILWLKDILSLSLSYIFFLKYFFLVSYQFIIQMTNICKKKISVTCIFYLELPSLHKYKFKKFDCRLLQGFFHEWYFYRLIFNLIW